jgi:hypothetical protein
MSILNGHKAPALLLAFSFCTLLAPPAPAAAPDPAVTLDFPFALDVVAGTVNISGTSEGAGYVNVSVDGGGWNRATGVGGWLWPWNTTGYADGTHSLLAQAVNGSRASGVVSVQVLVNNSPPGSLELSLDLESHQVYAGEPFAVSGLARFDTGVRLAGAAVVITVGNATWNATTDRRGYYSATVLAPEEPGEVQVRAQAAASGLSASAQDHAQVVPRAAADLSVTASDIRFTPAQPYSDEEVTVNAVIRNLGGGNATARVNFSTPGLPDAVAQVSVPAGESRNPSATWKLAAGNHTVNVTISDIRPYDSNSSDDRATTSLVVLARPDLVMAAVVASNSRPYAGLNVTLQARVNNTGDREASGVVSFYDGPPVSGVLLGSQNITVAAHSSVSAYIGWNATGPGDHVLYAVVTDVYPAEANAANNQLDRTVTVRRRPAAPEPGGAIPGFGALAALASLAAVLGRRAFPDPKS